jgi:hypothetical protein
VAIISPASSGPSAVGSTAVDMQKHREVLFIVQTGVMGSSATVDMKLQTGATSSPTTDLSGKAITQLVKATDDGAQASIGIRASDLPSGHRYVRALVTTGTAASITNLVGVAEQQRFEPASDYSLATTKTPVN